MMQGKSSTGHGGARAGSGRAASDVVWKQIRVNADLHSRLQIAATARGLNLSEYCALLLTQDSSVLDNAP